MTDGEFISDDKIRLISPKEGEVLTALKEVKMTIINKKEEK